MALGIGMVWTLFSSSAAIIIGHSCEGVLAGYYSTVTEMVRSGTCLDIILKGRKGEGKNN